MVLISVHVTLTCAPENLTEFLDLIKQLGEKAAAEPHCLSLEVFTSQDTPGEVTLVETYNKDRKYLEEEQLAKPYFAEYFPKMGPLLVKEKQVGYYDVVPAFRWANQA
ncbi:hypothetical protein NA57DRAFT_70030 [Rhizodiscina lignyota]|uniref:ABM domain-containing protein n=1 Tax=Rhizodiscina lignyota TaxID=1504668 RepID=A0A9P4ILN3_9PEZI|nr:hypothetical protein NA57DRAFT_70030 [Rhizodiscina lignyota]